MCRLSIFFASAVMDCFFWNTFKSLSTAPGFELRFKWCLKRASRDLKYLGAFWDMVLCVCLAELKSLYIFFWNVSVVLYHSSSAGFQSGTAT